MRLTTNIPHYINIYSTHTNRDEVEQNISQNTLLINDSCQTVRFGKQQYLCTTPNTSLERTGTN